MNNRLIDRMKSLEAHRSMKPCALLACATQYKYTPNLTDFSRGIKTPEIKQTVEMDQVLDVQHTKRTGT